MDGQTLRKGVHAPTLPDVAHNGVATRGGINTHRHPTEPAAAAVGGCGVHTYIHVFPPPPPSPSLSYTNPVTDRSPIAASHPHPSRTSPPVRHNRTTPFPCVYRTPLSTERHTAQAILAARERLTNGREGKTAASALALRAGASWSEGEEGGVRRWRGEDTS